MDDDQISVVRTDGEQIEVHPGAEADHDSAGSGLINRADYHLAFNAPLSTGGVLISDKITIELEISAVKAGTD